MEEPLLIDFTSGRIGTFIKQEQVIGQPNLVHIYYKPLGRNPFKRVEKILNIPIDGIVDVTRVETPFPWKIIISDGRTDKPAVVLHELNLKYTQLISRVESIMTELATEKKILETEKSELIRSKDEVIKKEVDRITGLKKRQKKLPFASFTESGTEEY